MIGINIRSIINFVRGRCYQNSTCKQHVLCKITNASQKPNNQLLLRTFWQNHLVKVQHRQFNSSTSTGFNFWRLLWRNIFGKYLLITNIIGSGVLMVIGDVVAQEIEYRRQLTVSKQYDALRIGRMFIVGAMQGPLHHYAYNWMEKLLPVANTRNSVIKILLDELIMSPICILTFFYSACFLERKSLQEANAELREKFLCIYLIDWLVWPGAQYINFRYLDIRYRVTYVNACTAFYNIFMSYMKHEDDNNLLQFFKSGNDNK